MVEEVDPPDSKTSKKGGDLLTSPLDRLYGLFSLPKLLYQKPIKDIRTYVYVHCVFTPRQVSISAFSFFIERSQ